MIDKNKNKCYVLTIYTKLTLIWLIFFPSLEIIDQLTVKPTEGESFLLNRLAQELDDTFDVYFNPYLDGDRPDFLILKKDMVQLLLKSKTGTCQIILLIKIIIGAHLITLKLEQAHQCNKHSNISRIYLNSIYPH